MGHGDLETGDVEPLAGLNLAELEEPLKE